MCLYCVADTLYFIPCIKSGNRWADWGQVLVLGLREGLASVSLTKSFEALRPRASRVNFCSGGQRTQTFIPLSRNLQNLIPLHFIPILITKSTSSLSLYDLINGVVFFNRPNPNPYSHSSPPPLLIKVSLPLLDLNRKLQKHPHSKISSFLFDF